MGGLEPVEKKAVQVHVAIQVVEQIAGAWGQVYQTQSAITEAYGALFVARFQFMKQVRPMRETENSMSVVTTESNLDAIAAN